jgi:ribosome-associated protein
VEAILPKLQTVPGHEGPFAPGLAQSLSRRVVEIVLTSLDDDKAEDTVVIDLAGKTTIADAMIITSGRSGRHVGAMADHLLEKLKAMGVSVQIEGQASADWVLIDAGDVIVHLFRPEVRAFYNIEKMWGVDSPVFATDGAGRTHNDHYLTA